MLLHADGNLSGLYPWFYRKAHPDGAAWRLASHPVRQRFLRVLEYRLLLRVPHTFVLREPISRQSSGHPSAFLSNDRPDIHWLPEFRNSSGEIPLDDLLFWYCSSRRGSQGAFSPVQ